MDRKDDNAIESHVGIFARVFGPSPFSEERVFDLWLQKRGGTKHVESAVKGRTCEQKGLGTE